MTEIRDSTLQAQPIQERATAPEPNLHASRLQIFSIFSIDLADLVADRNEGLRALQALRATDKISSTLRAALVNDAVGGRLNDQEIADRMRRSVEMGGKAVWTATFLERFAPIDLPTFSVQHDSSTVSSGDRIEKRDLNDPLHFARLDSVKVKMFGDGTLTFTFWTDLEDRATGARGTDAHSPAPVSEIIRRLSALEEFTSENFRRGVRELVNRDAFRNALESNIRCALARRDALDLDDVVRRSKRHSVVFVERFFDRSALDAEGCIGRPELDDAGLPLETVLRSSSLAGILNTASWYQHYNSRYVGALGAKEIGYRDDEIYITDRKTTLVAARGFWDQKDPLSQYKQDIVLAVEYNLGRLAYFAAILNYYQVHPDVHAVENLDPAVALPQVIAGRAVLSLIEESLDLTLLVDHGFTRRFIARLREELGFATAIGFIRQRVEDASTSVGLKSSVLAAEHTSRESLAAALEGNVIQRKSNRWAIATAATAILGLIATITIALVLGSPSDVRLRPGTAFCVGQASHHEVVRVCAPPVAPSSQTTTSSSANAG